MEELELTSNAALTDAVYEVAPDGSFLTVKLAAGAVPADKCGGLRPERECYHVGHPAEEEPVLFEQPTSETEKVPVYGLGARQDDGERGCRKPLGEGESRMATSRKVVSHGPTWVYAALAVGMARADSEAPFMVVLGGGTYGAEDTTESELIGYTEGRIREMAALLVRRARLEGLALAAIRVGCKHVFAEPRCVGMAKVKA